MEIWKDVEDYEGIYQVSNLGNVRSLNYRRKGLISNVKQGIDHYGYPKIRLYKNGVRLEYKVHRLVAKAFLDNSMGLPEVNHKDYNRKNNNISNLEWVSKLDNIIHQSKRGLFGRQATTRRIIAIPINGGETLLFNSVKEASQGIGVAQCCISYCLSGKQKFTRGYIVKGA
ncbi:MAG: EnPhEFRM31 [Firmicutes bacterium]|nr:EnPhEFRM31 [Bacillota bacterium]